MSAETSVDSTAHRIKLQVLIALVPTQFPCYCQTWAQQSLANPTIRLRFVIALLVLHVKSFSFVIWGLVVAPRTTPLIRPTVCCCFAGGYLFEWYHAKNSVDAYSAGEEDKIEFLNLQPSMVSESYWCGFSDLSDRGPSVVVECHSLTL